MFLFLNCLSKGFCWGVGLGIINGITNMTLTSLFSSYGISGFASISLKFIVNGSVFMTGDAIHARIEGERWNAIRAAISFGIGGASSLIPDNPIISGFIDLSFGTVQELFDWGLQLYSLVRIINKSIGD